MVKKDIDKTFTISQLKPMVLTEIDGDDAVLATDKDFLTGRLYTKKLYLSSIALFMTVKDLCISLLVDKKIIDSILSGEISNELSNYGKTLLYISSSKMILLKNNDNVLGLVDCSEFLKDGMLSNVLLSDDKLIFTFNPAASCNPISVCLSSLLSRYTAGRGLSLDIASNTFSTAEEYTTYENVRNLISNDIKPIWIYDWTE